MFELKNISKQFHGEYALRDVSLTMGRGLHFLIGPSGSGKTTLLNIMTGMERNFEGQAFYCGQDLKALTDRERCGYYNSVFGFVWQDFNLLEDRTVLENVIRAFGPTGWRPPCLRGATAPFPVRATASFSSTPRSPFIS